MKLLYILAVLKDTDFILLAVLLLSCPLTEECGGKVAMWSLRSDKRLGRQLEIPMMESGTEIPSACIKYSL